PTPWYHAVLQALEKDSEKLDVTSRLEAIVRLIQCHASDGNLDEATRLVWRLVPMAFGVGYRKDYQFSAWVDWLARAMKRVSHGQLVQDAAWMARLIVAAEPMTEGAPASAAAKLPAAAVATSPMAAVRFFEFLFRFGGPNHLDAA